MRKKQFRIPSPKTRRLPPLAIACFAVAVIGSGVIYLVRAQSGSVSAQDAADTRKAAEYTITHPAEANTLAESLLTPAQKGDRDFQLWAINHPGEYYTKFVKDDPTRSVPKEAIFAISNPVEACAQALKTRTPEQKAEDERISYGIEHPLSGN